MLRRYMHKRERYFAMLNDNRVVRPFEWGLEFIKENPNGDSPEAVLAEFSKQALADSDRFFALSDITDYQLDSEPGSEPSSEPSSESRLQAAEPPADSTLKRGLKTDSTLKRGLKTGSRLKRGLETELKTEFQTLTWTSAVKTISHENNTVYAQFFPFQKNKKAAVVVLPHWNAKAGSYFDLCRMFKRVGISALRLTLPYHEQRMPAELERADHLVAPNIGRTIESVRQAVLDTRAAVRWLKEQGYEKIGLVGTSIGSCVGFLSFVHDRQIDASVFNHVSSYVADVVWNGLSTYHVREALEQQVSLEQLREYWLPISPAGFVEKLSKQPARPQRYIYTLYDLTFPIDLSRQTMQLLRQHKIKFSKSVLPCGHYTLGEKPWVYLDGYKIVSFLKRHLR